MHTRIFSLLTVCSLAFVSCKHEPAKRPPVANGNYPSEIANIIVTKCATAGCHNEASYSKAGNIRLDTWEHMFEGGSNGAIVVPYSPEFSSLMYYINAHPETGEGVATPLMPKDAAPLSREEYLTIKNWVAKGCPSRDGEIPFASEATTRQKIYMTMQACDKVAVVDAKTKLVMRYIDVGVTNGTEVPHCVRVSADGQYAYVSFTSGTNVQKINTTTDMVENSYNVGVGQWNVVHVSPDGKKLMVSDMSSDGKAVLIDQEKQKTLPFGPYTNPHGIASNASFDTFYVTGQVGNTVHVFSEDGYYNEVFSVDNLPPTQSDSSRNLHEIIMSPDYSKYFVTCDRSNEVRVMDRKTNKLIKAIDVGKTPKEFAISTTKPYLFVSCEAEPNDQLSTGTVKFKGSVEIINYETLEKVVPNGIKWRFSEVHGVAVDDKNGVFYVMSRNTGTEGPAPHHTSTCGGKNGFYHVYDLNTLQPVSNKQYEVLPDPYSADTRFK